MIDKGLAVFLALVALGLVIAALSGAVGRIDTWIIRTPSKTAPLVVGLGVWALVLTSVAVAFVLAIRWLP
jgi:uncharacterized membrane protein